MTEIRNERHGDRHVTASLPVFAPNTGLVFDRWRPMPDAEVERAVEIVDRGLGALEGIETRREILGRCIEAMTSRRQMLADLVVREVGKKPEEALGEVDYAASFLDAARAALDELSFEWRPEPERLIRDVPYRVALLVAPFNDPPGPFFSPGRGGEMSETTDAGVDSGRAPNSPRRPHGGGSDPANGVFGLSGQSCPTPPGGAPGRA